MRSWLLPPLISIGTLLGLWEAAPRLGWVDPGAIPPLSRVGAEMGRVLADPVFRPQVGASASRWAIGVAIAIAVGVPIGLLMGRSRLAYRLIDPILTMTYPVPKASLILLFIFWWGAGTLSRVAVIVLACLIPIVISTYHGARAVEPHLLWSARGLGTSRLATFPRVVLPAALPQILSGVRLALTISLFAVLASELLIRQTGVGAYLFTSYDTGQPLRVWACAVLIAVTGFLLDVAFVRAVRLGLRWLEGEV